MGFTLGMSVNKWNNRFQCDIDFASVIYRLQLWAKNTAAMWGDNETLPLNLVAYINALLLMKSNETTWKQQHRFAEKSIKGIELTGRIKGVIERWWWFERTKWAGFNWKHRIKSPFRQHVIRFEVLRKDKRACREVNNLTPPLNWLLVGTFWIISRYFPHLAISAVRSLF